MLDSRVRSKLFLDDGNVSRTVYKRALEYNDYSVHVVKCGTGNHSNIGWQREQELLFRQLWAKDDEDGNKKGTGFTVIIQSINPKSPYCVDEERRSLLGAAGYSSVARRGLRHRSSILAAITIEKQSEMRFSPIIKQSSSTIRTKKAVSLQTFIVGDEVDAAKAYRTKVTMRVALDSGSGAGGTTLGRVGLATATKRENEQIIGELLMLLELSSAFDMNEEMDQRNLCTTRELMKTKASTKGLQKKFVDTASDEEHKIVQSLLKGEKM